MAVDFSQSTDQAILFAGQYASLAIQGYLNNIHAAAYPHVPQDVGGTVYLHFTDVYESLQRLSENDFLAASIAKGAVSAVDDFLRYVGEKDEPDHYEAQALPHFEAAMENIQALLAGESPQNLLHRLQSGEVLMSANSPGTPNSIDSETSDASKPEPSL